MKATVNGETRAVEQEATLGAMIDALTPSRRGIAIAVNGVVVPRSRWDEFLLREGDRVEVVGAAKGG